MDSQPSNDKSVQDKALDEKFCGSCGEIIKIKAEICPKCGVRERNPVSKTALLLITFFLGGIGGHKFYTGKNWQGFFYFIFCWTGITSLIALIEFIVYAFTSSEKLQEKYSASGSGVIIALLVGVGLFFIIGILAAIAIPQFVAFRNLAAVRSDLQNLLVAEQAYFVEYNQYSVNVEDLNFASTDSNVTIKIISADETCFEAEGVYGESQRSILIDCNGFKK